MGKVRCQSCKKSCKGQAIRLQDTYFCIKCFQCKQCKKQLATVGFFTKDSNYFCGDCYQKLFGTKCAGCGKYVEGEVITALGNTYCSHNCFKCTNCEKTFGAGDKVTYTGKDYVCNVCLEQSSAPTTPHEGQALNGKAVEEMEVPKVNRPVSSGVPKPTASSTPAKPLQDDNKTDGTLSSPISDMSDIYTDKENVTNGVRTVSSPVSTTRTSGYRSDDVESPRPYRTSRASGDSSVFDEFLALPKLKSRDSGYMPSHNETLDSVTDSVFAGPSDNEKQDRLSPMQNMMQYRSPSPCTSTVSKKSRESTLSSNSRHEVDYGKFYNTSYLEKPSGASIRGPSINLKGQPRSPHYHRPDNFSYSQVRKDFIRPMKKETSSMMSALGETMSVQKKKMQDVMDEPMKNKEVIDLARYPDNVKYEQSRQSAIEREDFPAPPATAAAYPELLYKHYKTPRKCRGSSDGDSPDGFLSMEVDGEEEDPGVDPKLLKDIDHLSKLERQSGAAKVFLEHLKKKSKEPPAPIDPVSSSRTPAADREPMYKTRYESHVFASPSRDLEYRSRLYNFLDDQMIGRKYRSALQSMGNFPVMRPGYTLCPPRTAHMPSTFASGRNGYYSDIEHCVTRDSDFEDLDRQYEQQQARRLLNSSAARPHQLDSRVTGPLEAELQQKSPQDGDRRSQKSHSTYTSQSGLDDYDPVTGLRKGGKLRGSSMTSDISKVKSPYHKTMASILKSEEQPQMYDYEELKITNLQLPPGVDRNWIEVHLSKEDFESIFKMGREEFYRLAEWKRNDMKQRVLLF